MHKDFLAEARKHAASDSIWVEGTPTPYGRRAGYPSLPWDGAFVDCIIFDSGVTGVPSFVNREMAFSALAANGEVGRKPRPGDVVLTAFGQVGILEGISGFEATVIAGDQPVRGRNGSRQVQRVLLTKQDIVLHATPRGIPSAAPGTVPSGPQIRSDPERYLRGALQSHPYTRGYGPVSMSSALYRWALLCGARPEDAETRRYRDEYLIRLGVESGYFQKGLR